MSVIIRLCVATAAAAALTVVVPSYAQRNVAADVYDTVAPGVVFVDTDGATGSGILLEGDVVLTAAHVVHPYRTARLVFPDGIELASVDVIAWDLMTDIALLGPVDVPVRPLRLQPDGPLRIGADVFFIGYPGEEERSPQPALSRGILSRLRTWHSVGFTYLQTDAALAPGQSGGVLANDRGQVIGMAGFFFADGSFGLAASAADLLPRVASLREQRIPSGLGDRRWSGGRVVGRTEVTLDTLWAQRFFVIDAQPKETVTFKATGDNDVAMKILDAGGTTIAESDERTAGAESLSATLQGSPPFLLRVEQFSEEMGTFRISGTVPLELLPDPDDGVLLNVPDARSGSLDFPSDVDYYLLTLASGDRARVRVASVMVDPLLRIDFRFAGETEVRTDDDSGGGLFGLDASLLYEASGDKTYFVVVTDAGGNATGGYRLSVERVLP